MVACGRAAVAAAVAAAAVAVAQSSSSLLFYSSSSLLVLSSLASSFPFSPLAALSAGLRLPATNAQWLVGCLLLSTALLFVGRCPAIFHDCVAGRRPPTHLVALVSPAASAFIALWTWSSLSSSSSSLRVAVRACWRAQSRGGGPACPPALAAVIIVLAARCSGGRMKPMRVVQPPAIARQSRHPSSSALPLPRPPRHRR